MGRPRSLDGGGGIDATATLMLFQRMRMPLAIRAIIELKHSSEHQLQRAMDRFIDAGVVKVPMGGS
jgi:hypothetical protein